MTESIPGLKNAMFEKAVMSLKTICSPCTESRSAEVIRADLAHLPILVERFGDDYQKLKCYMGDTAFADMARKFMVAQTTTGIAEDSFAHQLPTYLRNTVPYERYPELAEFAILELMLNNACLGAAGSAVTIGDLSDIVPETFACAVFDIQKPLFRLTFNTNVTSLWSSLRCGVTPPKPEVLAVPVDVIVWRQAHASRFRIIGKEESVILEKAIQGVPFGELCDVIAKFGESDTAAGRAAGYLRGWIDAELISAINIPATCDDSR